MAAISENVYIESTQKLYRHVEIIMQKDRRGEKFNIDYKIKKSKGFVKVPV